MGKARRLVLLAHVTTALGWLGVDVVIGVLAVTGLVSDDPARIAACYTALGIFAVPLLLIFGLSTLATGLLLGLGSGWGVLRYWWVVTKLGINVVLSSMVLILLRPRVNDAGVVVQQVDGSLSDRLGGISSDLIYPAFVSGAALISAALLGTFKPWGRTPYGRRSSATSDR